jgi:hypothetical protein
LWIIDMNEREQRWPRVWRVRKPIFTKSNCMAAHAGMIIRQSMFDDIRFQLAKSVQRAECMQPAKRPTILLR